MSTRILKGLTKQFVKRVVSSDIMKKYKKTTKFKIRLAYKRLLIENYKKVGRRKFSYINKSQQFLKEMMSAELQRERKNIKRKKN